MAINVITGQPRNGKSQRMIAQVIDVYIKENDKREKQGKPRRPIYIDIAGVNDIDTPTKLPDCITEFEKNKIWFGEHDDPLAPADYWKPPYGSIFVFDECHRRYWVKDTSGTISREPATISLNEHGHAGHDIWLLTQFAHYIHTHIHGLVQEHWHVKRIMKMKRAKVYKWDEFYRSPRSETAFANAFEVENFKFKKKYEDAYKSASAHAPMKITFPKVLIAPLLGILVLFVLFLYFSKDSSLLKSKEEKEKQAQVQAQIENKTTDLQKQSNEQKAQIDQLQAELKELKEKYLPKHIAILAQYEDVRPAMIIANATACQAFNTYGEPLNLPDSLCFQMNDYPSMIPRSRQKNESSNINNLNNRDSMLQASFGQNTQQSQLEVKPFDHTQDFK